MGGCVSYDKAHEALKSSVIGSLIKTDKDFDDFFRLCKTEVYAISSVIYINSNQAFYVVVSGEVLVTLKGKDDRAILVNTYRAGEIIHFFRCGTILAGSIISHDIRLTLSFRATESVGIVVGIDYDKLDYYLDRHPHLQGLKDLNDLNWAEFRHLPAFESLSMQQLNLLGPMIKLQACKPTEILAVANQGLQLSNDDHSETVTVKSANDRNLTTQVGMVLTGKCLVVPQYLNLFEVLKELGTGMSLVDSARSDSGRRSVWNKFMEAVGLPASERYAQLDEVRLANEILSALSIDRRRETTQIFPGSLFGFENYFSKHGHIALDSILSLDGGLIGYIDCDTLKQLFRFDRRYKRIMQRNFFRSLLDIVKPVVPMLSDMDDKKYSIFSCLVSLRCYQKDEVIFSKGNESFYSYIVIRGSIIEETEDNSRKLEFGSLFGEVSLITDTPYFSTTYAAESTALICIDKYAFDRVYSNDQEKLAELRIKLFGKDVELQYILAHKISNQAFQEYLKKQMAMENILFLNAVNKFEEIMKQMNKEIWKVLGKEAYEFFEVIASQQYQFFEELITQQASRGSRDIRTNEGGGGGGNPMDLHSNSTVIPRVASFPSSPSDPVLGEGKGVESNKTSNSSATSNSENKELLSHTTTSSTADKKTGGNVKGLLRRSFENTRASSFKQITQEMEKITDVIKQAVQKASPKSFRSAHIADGNNSSRRTVREDESDAVKALLTPATSDNLVTKFTPLPTTTPTAGDDSLIDDDEGSISIDYPTEVTTPLTHTYNPTTAMPKFSPRPGIAEDEKGWNDDHTDFRKPLLRIDTDQRHRDINLQPIFQRLQSDIQDSGESVFLSRASESRIRRSASEDVPGQYTFLSPFKDKPDRDIATLFQNYNSKFVTNIMELKEVARTIMEKHILPNCPLEINIPQKMRLEAIDNFEKLMKNSVGRCLHELYDTVYRQQLHHSRVRSVRRIGPNPIEGEGRQITTNQVLGSHCINKRGKTRVSAVGDEIQLPEDVQVSRQSGIMIPCPPGATVCTMKSAEEGLNVVMTPMASSRELLITTTSLRQATGEPVLLLHGGEDSFRKGSSELLESNNSTLQPDQSFSLNPTPAISRRSTFIPKETEGSECIQPVTHSHELHNTFATLFQPLHQEIYQLLSKDSFQRWKQTTEFEQLLAKITPPDIREYRDSLSPSTNIRLQQQHLPFGSGEHHPKQGTDAVNEGTIHRTDRSGASPLSSTHSNNPAAPLASPSNSPARLNRMASHLSRTSSRLSLYVTSRSSTSNQQPPPNGNVVEGNNEKKPMFNAATRLLWKKNAVAIDG